MDTTLRVGRPQGDTVSSLMRRDTERGAFLTMEGMRLLICIKKKQGCGTARMEKEPGRLTLPEHGVQMVPQRALPGVAQAPEDPEGPEGLAGQADPKGMGKAALVNLARDRTDGLIDGLAEAPAAEDQGGQVAHPEDPEAVALADRAVPMTHGETDGIGMEPTGVMMLGAKAAAGEIPWSKSRISQLS